METNQQISPDGATRLAAGAEPGGDFSPELVRRIAEKVYEMLLEDLRFEKERHQPDLAGWNGIQGGGCHGHID
jgi:hypothetical protein